MASRRKHPELLLSIEDVTPEIAKLWLESNTRNRKVSERLVHIYAEAMSADEWVLSGEGIIFDRDGHLQSGQHRLLAIIESGVTIRTLVVRNADPASLYALDSGRKRRLTDVLTLRGESDVMNLSTLLSWTWRWENGLMDRPGDTATNTHMLKMLDTMPDLRECLTPGRQMRTSMGLSAGLLGACFYQFHDQGPDDAQPFFDMLCSGENLASGDPGFAWRRWVIRSRALPRGRKPNSVHIAAITTKAWNAWRSHEQMSQVFWKAGEAFPEVL